MRALLRALLACVLVAALPPALYGEFPKHTGFVNDFANLLSPAARAELEQLLHDTEQQTTAEVALATVPTLEGMSVEEYANRLFKEWGIGKDAIDNGVLVLVAPNERAMRIEVGYGLEPVLPDGLAGQIIRETFLPRFRNDDYPGGITDGVARVVDLVRRKHILTAAERAALAGSAGDKAPWYITIPFLGAFVGIGFYMIGIGLGSKVGFPILFGGFFGGVPLLISLIPMFSAPLYVMGPWALFAFVMGLRSGRRGSSFAMQMRQGAGSGKGTGSRHGGGWVMGGSSGSGSRSSSSSGSSFGGGSSGGGGASGRW